MQITKIQPYLKTNFLRNNQAQSSSRNVLKNDVFIKNQNEISFQGGRFAQKYNAISAQMTDYMLNSKEISYQEIENILQKHSPETSVLPFSQLETNKALADGTSGYTKIPVYFVNDPKSGKTVVITAPKKVYINIPDTLTKEGRIILLSDLLHEFTHVFQEESKDRTPGVDFFNSHLQKSKDINATINTLQALPNIFTTLEDTLIGLVLNSCCKEFGKTPQRLQNQNETYDSIFQKGFKLNARDVSSAAITCALGGFNVQDINMALDYIILKAGNEEEAYKNALDNYKTLLGIEGKTSFDLRIEGYQKIAEAAKRLKGMQHRLK